MAFADSYVKKREAKAYSVSVSELKSMWLAIRCTLNHQVNNNKPFRIEMKYLTPDTVRCLRYAGFTLLDDINYASFDRKQLIFVSLYPN